MRIRADLKSRWQRAVMMLPDEQSLRSCHSKRGHHPFSGEVTQRLKIAVLELKSDHLLAYLDIEVQQLAKGFDPHAIALLHPFQITSGKHGRRLIRFTSLRSAPLLVRSGQTVLVPTFVSVDVMFSSETTFGARANSFLLGIQ